MPHEVGRPGPLELLQFGPVASIAIGATGSSMRQAKALVDTGAQSGFVHERLSESLGMRRVDRRDVSDVQQTRTCDVVEAHIVLGDLEIPSPRQFVAYPINRRMSNGRFNVILGRDVLANLDLHYRGLTGSVSLSRPHIR